MTIKQKDNIIELPKAKRIYSKDTKNKIVQWMMFFDNPNKGEVVKIMEENRNIKKAIEELEQVSGDEKIQRIAELREKAIRDEKAEMAYAKEHGYKEGFEKGIEDGKAESRAEGRAEGKAEGIEEGKIANKIEIAKRMLKKGIKIADIEEITGLEIEKIENLKKSL